MKKDKNKDGGKYIFFGYRGYGLDEKAIKAKSTAAAKEKELAGNAGNPGGNGGGANGGGEEKTNAEKVAESYAKRTAENNKTASDALASYLK